MAVRARTGRARILRKDATEAELALWRGLKEMKLPDKVRRQHPIGPYIADFAIPTCKLVIEVDGGQHTFRTDLDVERSKALQERGWRVLRFWNNDVLGNLDGVRETIAAAAASPPTSP